MRARQDEQFEEGQLPDDDPAPSEPAPPAKPNPVPNKSAPLRQEQDESSGEIIFETVVQKDYNYSSEKKKKIHKQETKTKTKQKEKTDRTSKDREKKTEKEKRKSPTPAPPQEEPTPQRDFQQPPMPQPFFNPYMYLPPVNNMMPHMFPPQFPPLPYGHPSQFHYPGPIPPIPPNAAMNHPHYAPPPPMYPGYPPKMMPMKPPENPAFKLHPAEYGMHQMHHTPPVPQKYPNQMKMEQPIMHPMHAPPIYHNQNQINKINPNVPLPQSFPPNPLPIPPITISRPQTFEKPREKERPVQTIREKKYDFKNEIKRDVKESLKQLPLEQQEELLEAIRCILKYGHLSNTLFSSESAVQANASLNCYEKNLAKLQRILTSPSTEEEASIIEHVLTSMQIKEPLMKIKERILYHKLISESEHTMGQQLRAQIQGKVV